MPLRLHTPAVSSRAVLLLGEPFSAHSPDQPSVFRPRSFPSLLLCTVSLFFPRCWRPPRTWPSAL